MHITAADPLSFLFYFNRLRLLCIYKHLPNVIIVTAITLKFIKKNLPDVNK